MVNHPSHYQKEGHKECIVEMRELYGDEAVMTFCKLNAFKYKYRAGAKGKYEQDMAKAKWYEDYAEMLRRGMRERDF